MEARANRAAPPTIPALDVHIPRTAESGGGREVIWSMTHARTIRQVQVIRRHGALCSTERMWSYSPCCLLISLRPRRWHNCLVAQKYCHWCLEARGHCRRRHCLLWCRRDCRLQGHCDCRLPRDRLAEVTDLYSEQGSRHGPLLLYVPPAPRDPIPRSSVAQ